MTNPPHSVSRAVPPSRPARPRLTGRVGRAAAWAAAGAALATLAGTATAATAAPGALPDLAQVMADPDWIGPAVEDAYFSVDGRAAYYRVRRAGTPIVDLHRIALADGKDSVVDGARMAVADGPGVWDRSRRRYAFVRDGDVFLAGPGSGPARQLTRSAAHAEALQFSADGRILSWRVGLEWWMREEGRDVVGPAAVVRAERAPDAEPAKPDDLRDFQLRTFSTLRKLQADRRAVRAEAEARARADATHAPVPVYLGDEVTIVGTTLSPDARWLVVVTRAKDAKPGMEGQLTRYVTESGYEEFEKERVRVGRNPPAAQSVWLVKLSDGTFRSVPLDGLEGINDDPLAAVRAENGLPPRAAKDGGAPTARGVLVRPIDPDGSAGAVRFSADGRALALQVRAIDNKDRWLARVDLATGGATLVERLTDPAWINWTFNEFGWLDDDRTLWFQSEAPGYAHLYVQAPGAPPRALTSGPWEVYDPVLSPDGRSFYFRANPDDPAAYDLYRVPVAGGAPERITRDGGITAFALDRTGRSALVTRASSYVPAQLAVVGLDGRHDLRALTDTRTPAYRAIEWIAPEFVRVPSTHGAGSIPAKVYRDPSPGPGPHPAVVFVHGAGYLQDVHRTFPHYFREQMYANLLARRGYVVIDLDYRGSQGYGRAWRTAIYRQMGHPELEDILDGKRWLVEHAGVDPARVGIYGGSYGGFMTLMALFRAPTEFAAGAALRPVTDWMQYDHSYTSNILNDPQVDPLSYARSSPIEFAAALERPLLICHGVIDDNVLFEDSMRLYQRLIELGKQDFWLCPYPLDRHGFTNAESWLDEYRRIDGLFVRTIERAH